eukprot:Lankesteria_metandrocarpae@DN9476_c0_g1_i1.p1
MLKRLQAWSTQSVVVHTDGCSSARCRSDDEYFNTVGVQAATQQQEVAKQMQTPAGPPPDVYATVDFATVNRVCNNNQVVIVNNMAMTHNSTTTTPQELFGAALTLASTSNEPNASPNGATAQYRNSTTAALT